MTDSGEIVNLVVVERVILALAVGLPILGFVVGAAWGAMGRRWQAGALQGTIAGLLGPLIWALWRIYNAIENHYGLDSVKALLINLALFLAVGIAIGAVWGWRSGVRAFRPSGETAKSDVPLEAPERPNA